MKIALKQAIKAINNDEVPIGAVIVCDDKVISQNHNLIKRDTDPTAHAEILCIKESAQNLRNYCLNKCDIYVTLEPCAMCAQAIAFCRIKRLYFGAYNEKFGAIENGVRLFKTQCTNYIPEIYGEIEQKKSTELLQLFFRTKRNNKRNNLYL